MVIMNYTLLNVFLAIAVDGLADFEMMNDAEKEVRVYLCESSSVLDITELQLFKKLDQSRCHNFQT